MDVPVWLRSLHPHRWARRRQGLDRGRIALTHRRVYILPTRLGVLAGAVLFTMLLGALNYSNNMGFALTFLLSAIAIVSMYQCQRNLVGLQVGVRPGRPGFAGGPASCEVELSSAGNGVHWQVGVGPDSAEAMRVDICPGETRQARLTTRPGHRGLWTMPTIRITSEYPLGLFRAWAWLYPEAPLLVYPAPASDAPTPQGAAGGELADEAGQLRGGDEFVGLRSAPPGEPASRLAWKAMARTGERLAKDYRSGADPVWLDWDAVPGADPELRIARLTRLALDAHAAGQPFGLALPRTRIDPAAGDEHLHRCLRALALMPGGTKPDEF